MRLLAGHQRDARLDRRVYLSKQVVYLCAGGRTSTTGSTRPVGRTTCSTVARVIVLIRPGVADT